MSITVSKHSGTAAGVARRLRCKLKELARAPFRVHHYRDVHSQMLRDALCHLDCGSEPDTADE